MLKYAPLFQELYNQGLTDRQIAAKTGTHHNTVGYWRKATNLKPNGRGRGPKIKLVSETEAECSRCFDVKPLTQFIQNRKCGKYTYHLSYCHDCRKVVLNTHLNRSIDNYLQNRTNRLRKRAGDLKLDFDITTEHLKSLYEQQDGKCFYTDTPMTWGAGRGVIMNALSMDRIDPRQGYVQGNVVLCCYRINAIKRDITLDEMKAWMPGWYERVLKFLKTTNGKSE